MLSILGYLGREGLKAAESFLESGLIEYEDYSVLTDWAHYQEFLEELVNGVPRDCATFQTLVTCFPSFALYRQWVKTYRGWTKGPLTQFHAAWKPHYLVERLPMNCIIQECKFLVSEYESSHKA